MKNQGASGCSLDALSVTSAAGKWMPINADGKITHLAKIEKVCTWRDMDMFNTEVKRNGNQQSANSPCWSVFNQPDLFALVMKWVYMPVLRWIKQKKNGTVFRKPESAADCRLLRETCVDMWKGVDHVQQRCEKSQHPELASLRQHGAYSLQLKVSELQAVYPPMPLPVNDPNQLTQPFNSTSCEYVGPVVCVEGSDIMGYNLHHGKQGGGNQTCMCPFCNAKSADIQKGPVHGTPCTRCQCQQWFDIFTKTGLKNDAARANTNNKPLYVPKYSSPVSLHLRLGLVIDLRKMINILCQKLDGSNKKLMAAEKKEKESKKTDT
jgi:hypothetical protein